VDLASSTWIIPASRSKNNKSHIVHLSEQAQVVLGAALRTHGLVFSTINGKRAQDLARRKPNWILDPE
jgi:integrase